MAERMLGIRRVEVEESQEMHGEDEFVKLIEAIKLCGRA